MTYYKLNKNVYMLSIQAHRFTVGITFYENHRSYPEVSTFKLCKITKVNGPNSVELKPKFDLNLRAKQPNSITIK